MRDLNDLTDRMFEGAVEVEKPLFRQIDLQRARAIEICSLTDLFWLIFDEKLTWKGRLAAVAIRKPFSSTPTRSDGSCRRARRRRE